MTLHFHDYDALIDRLCSTVQESSKKIVFILGSPVSAPINGNPGVADVAGIVDLIRNKFTKDKKASQAFAAALEQEPNNKYQAAFKFLSGWRGQDVVNEVIRFAVLGARDDADDARKSIKITHDSERFAEQLEKELTNWVIPDCLQNLAILCRHFPDVFGKLQLTTNFDPLLSLALKQQNLLYFRSILSTDGNLGQIQGNGCHIVHLHGYWYGVDTLHTPHQLTQARPRLQASLAHLLKDSLVVNVAYSGWDDVFTQTLLKLLDDESAKPDVLWTYYGDNEDEILKQNQTQIDKFSKSSHNSRINLYKGVNCHQLFADLLRQLIKNPQTDEQPTQQQIVNTVQPDYKFIQKVRQKIKQILSVDEQAIFILKNNFGEAANGLAPEEFLIPTEGVINPVEIIIKWRKIVESSLQTGGKHIQKIIQKGYLL